MAASGFQACGFWVIARRIPATLPARPRKPRDKAKVEACVGIVERWLLGRLIDELALAKSDGRIAARMKSLARVDLLILGDWGLQ